MLPFLPIVGDVPENPGFCMPRPPSCLGLGFFRLDLNGDLVMEDPTVEPLVDPNVVDVVFIETILPFDAAVYGLPLASVIDTPPPANMTKLVGYTE